jgi:hypothetical protein
MHEEIGVQVTFGDYGPTVWLIVGSQQYWMSEQEARALAGKLTKSADLAQGVA